MSLAAQIGRYSGLVLVTAVALGVMLANGWGWDPTAPREEPIRTPSLDELPTMPVSAQHLQLERVEVIDRYSGMIKPWERFQIGFDTAGRVLELGINEQGQPLDDGDPVRAGPRVAQGLATHVRRGGARGRTPAGPGP